MKTKNQRTMNKDAGTDNSLWYVSVCVGIILVSNVLGKVQTCVCFGRETGDFLICDTRRAIRSR